MDTLVTNILTEATLVPGPRPLAVLSDQLEATSPCFKPAFSQLQPGPSVRQTYGEYFSPFDRSENLRSPHESRVNEDKRRIWRLLEGNEAILPFNAAGIRVFTLAFVRQVQAFEASLPPAPTQMLSEAEVALGERLESLGGRLPEVLDGVATLPLDPTKRLTFACLTSDGKEAYVDALVQLVGGQGFIDVLDRNLLYHTACLHYALKPKTVPSSPFTDPLHLKALVKLSDSNLIDVLSHIKDAVLHTFHWKVSPALGRSPSSLGIYAKASLRAASLLLPQYPHVGVQMENAPERSRLMYNMKGVYDWYFQQFTLVVPSPLQHQIEMSGIRRILLRLGWLTLPTTNVSANTSLPGTPTFVYGGALPLTLPNLANNVRRQILLNDVGDTLTALVTAAIQHCSQIDTAGWELPTNESEESKEVELPPQGGVGWMAKVATLIRAVSEDVTELLEDRMAEEVRSCNSPFLPGTGFESLLLKEKVLTVARLTRLPAVSNFEDHFIHKLPHLRYLSEAEAAAHPVSSTTFPSSCIRTRVNNGLVNCDLDGVACTLRNNLHMRNPPAQLQAAMSHTVVRNTIRQSYEVNDPLQHPALGIQFPQTAQRWNNLNWAALPVPAPVAAGETARTTWKDILLHDRMAVGQPVDQEIQRIVAEDGKRAKRYAIIPFHPYELLAQQLPPSLAASMRNRQDQITWIRDQRKQTMIIRRRVGGVAQMTQGDVMALPLATGQLRRRVLEPLLAEPPIVEALERTASLRRIEADTVQLSRTVLAERLQTVTKDIQFYQRLQTRENKENFGASVWEDFGELANFQQACHTLKTTSLAQASTLIKLMRPCLKSRKPLLDAVELHHRWPSDVAWVVSAQQLKDESLDVVWPDAHKPDPLGKLADSLAASTGTLTDSKPSRAEKGREAPQVPSSQEQAGSHAHKEAARKSRKPEAGHK